MDKGIASSRVIRRMKNYNNNDISSRAKKVHRINLDGNRYKNQVENIKTERYSKIKNNNRKFNKKDANDYFTEIAKNKNLKQKLLHFENKIRNLKSDNNIPIEKFERKKNFSIPKSSKFHDSRKSITLTSSTDFQNPKQKLTTIKDKNLHLEDFINNLESKFKNISTNKNYESPIEKIDNLQKYYEKNIKKNSLLSENQVDKIKIKKNNSLGPLRFSKILKRTPTEVIEQITTLKIETSNDKVNQNLNKTNQILMKNNQELKNKNKDLILRSQRDKDYIENLEKKLALKNSDLEIFQNQIRFLENKNRDILNQNLKEGNKSGFIKLNNNPPKKKYEYTESKEIKEFFVKGDNNEDINYGEKNDDYKIFLENENKNHLLELGKSKKNFVKLKKDYEEIIKKLNFANFELDNKTQDIMELNEKIMMFEKLNQNKKTPKPQTPEKIIPNRENNVEIQNLKFTNQKLLTENQQNMQTIKIKDEQLRLLERDLQKQKFETQKSKDSLKKLKNEKLNLDQSSDKMKEFSSTMIRHERNTEDDKYSIINAKNQKDIYKILNDLGLKDNLVNILELKLRNATEINENYKKKIDGLYQEIEDLKLIEINYFNQIKDLETEIDLINTDGDKFENSFKSEIDKVKKFYEGEIFKLTENNENKLNEQNELIKEFEEKIDNLNNELQNSINTINILESELLEMENTANSKITQILEDFDENKNLLETILQKKKQLEEEILNIKPFYENQLEDMTNNFENIMKQDKEKILKLEEELRYYKMNKNEEIPSSLRSRSIINKDIKTTYEKVLNEKNILESLLKESENKLEILKNHLVESEKALYELEIEVRKKTTRGFEGSGEDGVGEEIGKEEFDDMVTTCEEQKKLIENLLIKIFHISLFAKNKELSNIE